MVRGSFNLPYSAAGIDKYKQNNPVENTKITPKAAANSQLDNGNLPSLNLLAVGESNSSAHNISILFFSSSSLVTNRLVSTTIFLGAAIDNTVMMNVTNTTLIFNHIDPITKLQIYKCCSAHKSSQRKIPIHY